MDAQSDGTRKREEILQNLNLLELAKAYSFEVGPEVPMDELTDKEKWFPEKIVTPGGGFQSVLTVQEPQTAQRVVSGLWTVGKMPQWDYVDSRGYCSHFLNGIPTMALVGVLRVCMRINNFGDMQVWTEPCGLIGGPNTLITLRCNDGRIVSLELFLAANFEYSWQQQYPHLNIWPDNHPTSPMSIYNRL